MPNYWAPFATKSPVAFRDSQKNEIKPVGLVLHTAVSNSTNLRPSGTTRWHFYCNREGKLYQYFPVNHMAAAQLDGNEWYDNGWKGFISVETWDGAGTSVWPNYNSNPSGGPAWTPAQVASLAQLARWLHTEHGVPLIKATGARGTGIGYHRQFQNTSPYEWTSSHACPGTKRIAQVPGIIAIAKQGEDVPLTTTEIDKIARRVLEIKLVPNKNDPSGATANFGNVIGHLSNMEATQDVDHSLLRQLLAQNAALGKALAALAAGQSDTVRTAVQEALKDAVVNVDVNVTGGSE